MVQVLDDNRRPTFREQLSRGLSRGVNQAYQSFVPLIHEREENEAIQRLTGKNLQGLGPDVKRNFADRLAKTPENERLVEQLVASGVDPNEAELYSLLTQGGQTQFVKNLLEEKKRGKTSIDKMAKRHREDEDIEQSDNLDQLEDFLTSQDEGLTPSEKVSRGKERYSTGLKIFQEASTKLRGAARDKERLHILEKLNNSDKLPKSLGRANVNKHGDLRVPFLASPESQRFIKTLNEFSSGAKDTFGSRVTNFDLSQYLKRFPTLLNTKEGRKQVLEQMNIVNDINSTYYKNLKEIYKKAGGVRGIDADMAEALAEEKSHKEIERLVKKFDDIGEITSLPSASEFKGKKFRNKETGEILQSDGENWNPV